MAMIAACVLDPGVYFAVNAPGGVVGQTAEAAVKTISGWGFPVTVATMSQLAGDVGESSLFGRTGGAPSLALGMAHIFAASGGGKAILGFWYHFAIMFEALFILTIIDAGTRTGRFMLQDLLGQIHQPLGKPGLFGVISTSAAIVLAWGFFLIQGVRDPLGGINSLWPLFGIANQLLAAVALCVATTIIIKMGKARYAWTTLVPLAWLCLVTLTAGWQKVFAVDPRLGFLSAARALRDSTAPGTTQRIFNNNLDAALTLFFMAIVVIVIAASAREWWLVLSKRKAPRVNETPFVATAMAAGD